MGGYERSICILVFIILHLVTTFKDMVPDVQPTPPGEPHWFWLYRDDIHPHYLKES